MFKESFRVIRTNLVLRREDHGRSQVLIISSSMPQEGKSLTSLELARSFSELGDRTLLVDADLRRGKQTRRIMGKKTSGLADFLVGNAQVEPIQFEYNLDFLPSGRYSAQAIESLGRGDFVDQVQVYIENGRLARLLVDDVGVPNLLKHGLGHIGTSLCKVVFK